MSETTVLTFGVITEITGKSRLVVADVSSTAELKTRMEENFPQLKNIRYAVAVNKKMVPDSVAINSDDTIALLPPFSGG